MTVRTAAVEKRQEQTNKPAEVTPATVVREAIAAQTEGFRQALPKNVDPERFARLVLTAVKGTPELMRCFETTQGKSSVLIAAMQAATVGLEPNTATQDAWLLPRHNHDVWEAQLSIGYRGLMKLARRSGVIKMIDAEVVYENDHFRFVRGAADDIFEHEPVADDEDPGEMKGVYARVRYMNGGYQIMYLTRRQVEARRAMSDSWKNTRSRPYSPWTKWPEAMWRKSAIRALVPYLDLTAEDARVIESDELPLAINDEGYIDVDPIGLEELQQAEAEQPPENEQTVNADPATAD